nr:MAG TPA: hypothetical protein [Caudoviricetes sp.]
MLQNAYFNFASYLQVFIYIIFQNTSFLHLNITT